EWPQGRDLRRSHGAGGNGRRLLQRRLPCRTQRTHRLRAPVRTHDVPGFGQREEVRARKIRRGERRKSERPHRFRLHKLLRNDAEQSRRTRTLARIGSHALTRYQRGEPEEPAERRERRGPRKRTQPAISIL